MQLKFLTILSLSFLVGACSKSSSTTTTMNNNASNPSTSNPTSTVVPDIYKKYMEPVVSLLMVHLLLLKPMDYPIIKVLTMLVQMH